MRSRRHSPKFEWGSVAYVTYAPRGSGFVKGESVFVRSFERVRSGGFRYFVQGPGRQETFAEGWLEEGDLATREEAREMGYVE